MPERSRKDPSGKDPIAVELGRRGGLKGGKARAAKLTAEERAESARKAAQARWARQREARASQRDRSNEGNEERNPKGSTGRGERMTRSRISVLTGIFLVAGALTLFLVLLTARSSGTGVFTPKSGAAGDSAEAAAGLGPTSYEAYLSAERTYPATAIPPSVVARAKATFGRIAKRDARLMRVHGRSFLGTSTWKLLGPRKYANQPGVTSFSGATNDTASRVTAMVIDPKCSWKKCRLWVGVSGGGVWLTTDALASTPTWRQRSPASFDQNSVGTLTLDPTDKQHNTLYLGTGEGNRCSSGCEAGVGIYKSTDGGKHWWKLADSCVSNATYSCVNPGKDSFLGRGINAIVVDPTNKHHLFVGSAQAVRGLSHVIGNGGTTRLEPGANSPGVYESTDGGATFTEVWNGNDPNSFGVTNVNLDPLDSHVVYASAFDQGLWRRDAGAPATSFNQVFAPQFPGGGTDRVEFAPTVKNGHTRIYLTEGTANGNGISASNAATFWRIDDANQPAATLLASEAAGSTPPPDTTTYPTVYTGWQLLTSHATGSPYFAPDDFCTGQCWYDELLYTPKGLPDTVYLGGSMEYGEQPCDTKGVGCGNGRSNGRAVIYSTTAGDPDGANNGRTFTDLTYDAQDTTAPWCAYAPYFPQGCLHAPNGIHPDQHAIVINPNNPTQIFEGSDGGVIRTSGTFSDLSSQCDSPYRNGGGPLPTTSGSYTACKRLLSRAPTSLVHIDKKLGSTIQFINVAIAPFSKCEVLGGTQDNGTWSNLDGCDNNTFTQVIYGDGGNAVFDATQPTWMANEYTGGFGDSNFENGNPEKWVIATAPLVNSGEGPAFYWPQVGDPNPSPGTHPIYEGGKHVWRTWAFGAGHAGDVPQDTSPDIAGYEANCPEFVTSGAQNGCGDYRPLGGPMCTAATPCSGEAGDLTSTLYGSDRSGGTISWMARDGADHRTMWVATSAGRIFVTHNVDALDPATVSWHRIDSSASGGSPTRFPSGITVDPANPSHAWISYSGYNAATPTTPGHVFSVTEGDPMVSGSGTFTNLNVESGSSAYPTPFSDGDLPVSDVVRDDATHTLYVGTDFGVLRGDNDGASWHVTMGMPRYEVMHLEMQPSSRVPTCAKKGPCEHLLYAATHSQGIWVMKLAH